MNGPGTSIADPARSAPSRPSADDGFGRLVGGVAICCAALLWGWLSWHWYQQGIPGTPHVPLDWGQSSIRVYAPPDVAVSTTVEYRDESSAKPSGPRVSGSLEDISLEAESTRSQPYLVVLELAYGARLSTVRYVAGSVAKAPVEITTTYPGPDPIVGSWPVSAPVQLFVATVQPMQGRRLFGGVTGHVSLPVAVTANARTAVYTPRVATPGKCTSLGSPTTVIDQQTWLNKIVPDCRASTDKTETETISLSDMASNKRLDYANPAPSEPGQLQWSKTAGSLRVEASYVDLDDEANGQRLLFLSGVGVGLATAGLPIGLQIIAEERRRARRRTDKSGTTHVNA